MRDQVVLIKNIFNWWLYFGFVFVFVMAILLIPASIALAEQPNFPYQSLSGAGNIKSKLRSTILSIIQIIYFLIVYHTGNFFTMLASYDHIFIISIFKKIQLHQPNNLWKNISLVMLSHHPVCVGVSVLVFLFALQLSGTNWRVSE